jgi:cytochrome c-type biogenesis protein CcmH/NrfG
MKDDLRQARAALQRALAVNADNLHAHLYLARIDRKEGHLDTAAAHAQRAVALHPAFGPAWEEAANVAMAQARWAEAEAALRQAIRLAGPDDDRIVAVAALLTRNPNHVRALLMLVKIRADGGEIDKARSALDRAARLRPGDPLVREAAEYLSRASAGR